MSEEWNVDIFCRFDFDDYNESGKKLRSLEIPRRIRRFDVSKDRETMAVIDEEGGLHTFRLQRSKNMDELMNPD